MRAASRTLVPAGKERNRILSYAHPHVGACHVVNHTCDGRVDEMAAYTSLSLGCIAAREIEWLNSAALNLRSHVCELHSRNGRVPNHPPTHIYIVVVIGNQREASPTVTHYNT